MFRLIALQEFEMKSDKQLEKITQLKQLLHVYLLEHDSLHSIMRETLTEYRNNEQFLLKFIIGRKYDAEKAFRSILKYVEMQTIKYPDLFSDDAPECAKYAISHGILGVLKKRDSDGRTLAFLRASNWNPAEVSIDDLIISGRYIVEDLMKSESFLENGGILVVDCTGGSLRHARKFTVPSILKFVHVFWQAYPIKMKGIYYVNTPSFVRPIAKILKAFLPIKLRDRILFASGVNELHERFERKILPEFLGGPLSEEQAVLPLSQKQGSVIDIDHDQLIPA